MDKQMRRNRGETSDQKMIKREIKQNNQQEINNNIQLFQISKITWSFNLDANLIL